MGELPHRQQLSGGGARTAGGAGAHLHAVSCSWSEWGRRAGSRRRSCAAYAAAWRRADGRNGEAGPTAGAASAARTPRCRPSARPSPGEPCAARCSPPREQPSRAPACRPAPRCSRRAALLRLLHLLQHPPVPQLRGLFERCSGGGRWGGGVCTARGAIPEPASPVLPVAQRHRRVRPCVPTPAPSWLLRGPGSALPPRKQHCAARCAIVPVATARASPQLRPACLQCSTDRRACAGTPFPPPPFIPRRLSAGGFADSSVRLYDLRARAQGGSSGAAAAAASAAGSDWVSCFHGHSAPVFGLDFSSDNQLLFSASGDGTVR